MIVILPRRKVRFLDVLNKMKNLPLEDVIPANLTEDEVELHLPRFNTHSNMYLNKVLNQVSNEKCPSQIKNVTNVKNFQCDFFLFSMYRKYLVQHMQIYQNSQKTSLCQK